MSSETHDVEPFARTSHPADYVPRPETDRLLDQLEEWAIHGSSTAIWLVGSPGMGRTLLLRVLRERIAGRRNAIFLPYPILPPDELARWTLDALDRTPDSDPQAQLAKIAKRLSGKGGVLLLLDDAMWLPPETRDAVGAWSAASGGALRAVFATSEIPDSVAGGGPVEAALLTLSTPLEFAESAALLHAAMDRARFEPRQRARLNHAALLQLHDRSRGVPAQLLDFAAQLCSQWDEREAPAEPAVFADPGPLPTQRELARGEFAAIRDDTRPHRSAAPDPATSILAPTLPPERSTAAAVGVATAWVAAAGALVALMTASMTGWLREPATETAAVAAPRALPDVAASPAGAPSDARFDERAAVAADPLAAVPGPASAPYPEPESEPAAEPASPASATAAAEAVIAPDPEPQREPTIATPDAASDVTPDAAPDVAAAPAPPVAVDAAAAGPGLRVRDGVIGKGEWLAASLRKHGIPTSVATRIAQEVGDTFDFRRARAGQRYRITQDSAGRLVAFDYEIAPGDDLELRRVDGRYQVTRSAR